MEINSVFTVVNVIKIFSVATLSFFLALFFTPLWVKILKKYFVRGKEIVKENAPIFSSLHKKKEGTPTMGGVIIWFTVALITFLFYYLSKKIQGLSQINFLSRSQTLLPLGAMLVSAGFGLVDDLFGVFKRGGMKMRYRLILYTLVAIGGAWWFYYKLDWNFINIPFLGDFTVGLWYIPIFIFIIFATAFSANETDGLDGLSGGVFLTSFAALGAVAFVQQRIDLVIFISAIIGALVAFLWHNIYPARFFMGDTGVMALGVTLGIIAMLTNTALLLPVIGIIYVIESGSVILQILSKKIRKKKIFLSSPIHHHFEAKGWHETRVTMRFWMISAIGAVIGLIIFLVDSKLPPFFR